jgi:putative DeoR family transcriptional regulator (stage III sporulation protein D)
MKEHIRERAMNAAKHTIAHKCTVRETAKELRVSKSTIHKDLTERLPKINPIVASAVRGVLLTNKAERHIRGGEATRLLYRRLEDAERKKM